MHKRTRLLALGLLCGAVVLQPSCSAQVKQKKNLGEQVFAQHCASCHADGGNAVKPSHPVAGSKQLATLATFKDYLSEPPGHMPYYEHVVNDRPTLEALYKYCKQLKKPSSKQASLPRHYQ